VQAETVHQAGKREVLGYQLGGVRDQLVDGVLEENTASAVSLGVNPLRARDRDSSARAARSSPDACSSAPDIALIVRE
jgi:hypothetical protein